MAISSSATTDAVTANRVTLASANALAMSAPKAGPPVTWARKSAGSPASAALRNVAISSLRSRPDRSALTGTTPLAALPSVETTVGGTAEEPS